MTITEAITRMLELLPLEEALQEYDLDPTEYDDAQARFLAWAPPRGPQDTPPPSNQN